MGINMNGYDVIVIGGGQAGLAMGYTLQKAGLSFVILEAGAIPAGSWPHYYDSLKLFSPARYSNLPGRPFPGNPERYPTRDEVVAYLTDYAEHFQLPVRTNTRVTRVKKVGDEFTAETEAGEIYCSRAVVSATGSFSRPFWPNIPGRDTYTGTLIHSAEYKNYIPFIGQRVVVVGGRNSAVQIGAELAQVAEVTLSSRQPVNFVAQRPWGKDIHFWLKWSGMDRFPIGLLRPGINPKSSPLDNGKYQADLHEGGAQMHPMFDHFTPDGVAWSDGTNQAVDAVIFATGFQPNFPYLHGLDALDEQGRAKQVGGVSQTVPGLYFMGISYQRSLASATIRGVGGDAKYVVKRLKRYLASQPCCSRADLLSRLSLS